MKKSSDSLDLRAEAILKYAEEHTPEISGLIKGILTPHVDGLNRWYMRSLQIAFEAGRIFQIRHPHAELHNENTYSREGSAEMQKETYCKRCGGSRTHRNLVAVAAMDSHIPCNAEFHIT